MEKIRNWKQDFYTIWAGQAVSLITSGVLQMAIIWHLTNTTGSAMVLSMATLVGFLTAFLHVEQYLKCTSHNSLFFGYKINS